MSDFSVTWRPSHACALHNQHSHTVQANEFTSTVIVVNIHVNKFTTITVQLGGQFSGTCLGRHVLWSAVHPLGVEGCGALSNPRQAKITQPWIARVCVQHNTAINYATLREQLSVNKH